MKKILSIVLALALLLSLGVIMASAAGSATLVISTDKTEYAPGDKATVTFALTSEDAGVYGVRFTVAANSVLTNPQVTAGGKFALKYVDPTGKTYAAVLPISDGVTCEYDANGDLTNVSGTSAGVTGTMTLMTIQYTVASNAEEKTISDAVSATVQELFTDDTSFSDIACTVTNASLTVKAASPAVVYGDVNGDGNIDSDDAMLVLKYYVGSISASDLKLEAADVNGDSKIDSDDAMLILKYYVGTVTELPVT